MKYTAIRENWEIEFETNSQEEMDEYIKEHPNVFQVIYRKTDKHPDHLYYNSSDIDMSKM